MTPQERQRLEFLEQAFKMLLKSDRYTFEKHIQMLDGRNFQVGRGTGTKIGTETGQKIAFHGVTPVAQASAIAAPSTPGGVYSSAEAQSTVDAVNFIRLALKGKGITA